MFAGLAPAAGAAGAAVPQCHAALWTRDGRRGVMVLDDLRSALAASSPAMTAHASAGGAAAAAAGDQLAEMALMPARSPQQRSALTACDARAALAWLATFHATGAALLARAADAGASAGGQHVSTLWEHGAACVPPCHGHLQPPEGEGNI